MSLWSRLCLNAEWGSAPRFLSHEVTAHVGSPTPLCGGTAPGSAGPQQHLGGRHRPREFAPGLHPSTSVTCVWEAEGLE